MAESQSKIDAAAEKAFAQAAEKKAAEATVKPVEAATPALVRSSQRSPRPRRSLPSR